MDHATDRMSRQLSQNEVLPEADLHALWRLESGALRIDSEAPDGRSEFAHLALPGDYLGVESLAGMPDSLTVRAITPARLVPVMVLDEEQRIRVLTEAFIQGHRRCRELLGLRNGEAAVRIRRLLHLLAHSEHGQMSARIACTLPSLKDMAFIVSMTPESVCRVLSNMRQTNQLQPRVRKTTRSRTPKIIRECFGAADAR